MHPLISAMGGRITLSGSLSQTGATATITSATATISGSGRLLFSDISTDGSAPEYNPNGAGWSTITEGLSYTVASGQTLAVRCALPSPGTAIFNLFGNGTLIEAVTLDRT